LFNYLMERVKMKKLVFLLMLLSVTSSVWAAGTPDWWDGVGPAPGQTSRDRDWFNPANWVWSDNTLPGPGVPTAAMEVRMHRSSAAPYNLSCVIADTSPFYSVGGAVASVINIGGNSLANGSLPYGQLTIESGSLTVGNGLRVGGSSSSKRSGELFVNGGVINAPTYLAVGYGPSGGGNSGWMYMTDGTVNAGQFDIGRVAGTNGYADISGGTIYATDFRMKPAGGTGVVSLDLSGTGKIIVAGDLTARINQYIGDGWINDNVQVSLTMNPGKTTLFVVPEPTTLCLLGIGALSLIRRKK
jgi:hypothetical protein